MKAITHALDAMLVILVLLVVLALVVLRGAPALAGVLPLTILTSSMEPGLPPGSLILVDTARTKPQPGEIVTFRTAAGTLFTHRFVGYTGEYADIRWLVTKGDANKDLDEPIHPDQIAGTVTASAPGVGYVTWLISQPLGVILVMSIGLLLIAIRSLIPTTQKENPTAWTSAKTPSSSTPSPPTRPPTAKAESGSVTDQRTTPSARPSTPPT